MANKRADVLKLIRAIPATLGIRDHATKRCVDALKEVVEHLLVDTYSAPGESTEAASKAASGIMELEAGENITIDKKPGGVRRITSRDMVGGGGTEPIFYNGVASVVVGGDEITLDGDEATPDAGKVYGTDPTTGAKGWVAAVSEPEDPGAAVVTIGSAAEGAEAAETTTWTYAGTNGLKLYAMTRVAYYDAGDETVYGYVRLLTFDKYGRLYSIGAETRISIDVTVPES